MSNLAQSIHTDGSQKRARTWTYIDTKEKAIAARHVIRKYLRTGTNKDPARLALDIETYVDHLPPNWKKKKPLPRPIWDGKKWLGKMALIQIGLDPKVLDRQFIFDVIKLGVKFIKKCLADIIQQSVVIGHNIKYDLGFIRAFLGVFPKHAICTMTISQVFYAGDRIRHNLADSTGEFFRRLPNVFYEIAAVGEIIKTMRDNGEKCGYRCAVCDKHTYNPWIHHKKHELAEDFEDKEEKKDSYSKAVRWMFDLYKIFKKKQQLSDWSEELDEFQKLYSAIDVRVPFFLFERQCEFIDDEIDEFERKYEEGKGVNEVLQLEFAIIPTFTEMEIFGLKFNRKNHEEFVIPLLERMKLQAEKEIAKWASFRPKYEKDEKHLVFDYDGDPQDDQIKEDIKEIRTWFKVFGQQWGLSRNISIKTKAAAGVKQIRIVWFGKASKKEVFDVIRTTFTRRAGYIYRPEYTISLKSNELVKKALSKIFGRAITTTRAKELKKLKKEDPDNFEVVQWLLRWKKAADFNSKFGRGWLKYVAPNGFVYGEWNPLGSEYGNEIVSGRSSAKNPAWMQMAARDLMFAYAGEIISGSGKNGITADELIRTSVIPDDEECEILDADYSQIEPRMATQHSDDETLLRVFRHLLDMHGLTGQAIFVRQNPPKWVDEPPPKGHFDRDVVGKTTNLGVGYGMRGKAFAEYLRDKTDGEIDIDDETAEEWIAAYWDLYEGVREEMERCGEIAVRGLRAARSLAPFKAKYNKGERVPFGRIATDLGRRRRFCILPDHEKEDKFSDHELDADYGGRFFYNEWKRRINKVKLAAYNHTIQGSCADMLKLAIKGIYREILKRRATGEFNEKERIVLVLHDEIMCNSRKQNSAVMREIIESEMLKAGRRFIDKVPVIVDIGVGPSWAAAKSKKSGHAERLEYERKLAVVIALDSGIRSDKVAEIFKIRSKEEVRKIYREYKEAS